MARLVRLDRTGHTELAEWTPGDPDSHEPRRSGRSASSSPAATWASRSSPTARYEQVKELPGDAELVMLRRPIAGG